jgi:predicted PolB exonuclease-like 3'-5' exonuclease
VSTLVFDIETVPDTDLGRKLLDGGDLADEDIARAMIFQRLQQADTDFLPLYQHRIVAISVVLQARDELKVWSLGDLESSEAELIQRFFDGLDRYTPQLVSWNGGGFDLPVLHYRSLHRRIQSPRYWETGDEDRSFRYNNYLSRFHWRHIDLMDVLSGFQPRARARLDDIAVMLGFPGKMGLKGDQVWPLYQRGELRKIRDYCETDVLNTYLVYLRFQYMRGLLDDVGLKNEFSRVRTFLEQADEPHLRSFLAAWKTNDEESTS